MPDGVVALDLIFSWQKDANHPHGPAGRLPEAGVNAAIRARYRNEIVRGHGVPLAGVPDRYAFVGLAAHEARRDRAAISVPTTGPAQGTLEAGVPGVTSGQAYEEKA